MNHLWRGKVFTILGPVLKYGEADIGGAKLMPDLVRMLLRSLPPCRYQNVAARS
jgi:hypothetical protein